MESYILIPIIFLSYFIIQNLINVHNEKDQRKFELEKWKIKTSRRNVVVPMAINLINYITNNPSKISEETAQELIKVLNSILEIIKVEPENQTKLDEPKSNLLEILEHANLSADFVIKIQEFVDAISGE